jgi:hypothetical protein|tara:strand:+ start:3070 stop:3633 length:564 start_codon:yes stop_codon:yes gene_type:complete
MVNSGRPKVFGIGFHKTGTSSLGTALSMLGYRVAGVQGAWNQDIAEKAQDIAFSVVDEFDAFEDNPWPLLYRELDEHYPGSKFILTLRPSDEWIRSVVNHFGNESTPMRKWIYGVGSPVGNEAVYLNRYRKHNQDVTAYFAGRDESLLHMHITKGDGWDKLCEFLGEPIPDGDFPDINKAAHLKRID